PSREGQLPFTATVPISGTGRWTSDGSSSGTLPVLDINPTPAASSLPGDLTVVTHGTTETLLFSADDGVRGRELWASDGTPAGTRLVADTNVVTPSASANPAYLTNVNGTLFFAATNGISGTELWKSNGTPAGTLRVKDIHPGVPDSAPSNLMNVNGTLFFTANDGAHGIELWTSAGT